MELSDVIAVYAGEYHRKQWYERVPPVTVGTEDSGSSRANGIDVPRWKMLAFPGNRTMQNECYASWNLHCEKQFQVYYVDPETGEVVNKAVNGHSFLGILQTVRHV